MKKIIYAFFLFLLVGSVSAETIITDGYSSFGGNITSPTNISADWFKTSPSIGYYIFVA